LPDQTTITPALTAEERAQLAELLSPEQLPARNDLLLGLGETVRDRRDHDCSPDDWHCDNLAAYAGERIAAVLRRLLDIATENAELLTELGGRDDEARERGIQQQIDAAMLKSVDFRNGAAMELIPARETAAAMVAAARGLLGDAENYSETTVEWDIGLAGETDRYTIVIQRVGKVTPHQARRRAEAERDHWRERYRQEANLRWDNGLPPGGEVCATCGQPTESEPCPEHNPRARAERLAAELAALRSAQCDGLITNTERAGSPSTSSSDKDNA
jgi:hypothetical protein